MKTVYKLSGISKTSGQIVRQASFHYNSLAKQSKHPDAKKLHTEMATQLMIIAEKLDKLENKLDNLIKELL